MVRKKLADVGTFKKEHFFRSAGCAVACEKRICQQLSLCKVMDNAEEGEGEGKKTRTLSGLVLKITNARNRKLVE
jgi:hypothetical protein